MDTKNEPIKNTCVLCFWFLMFFMGTMMIVFIGLKPQIEYKESFIEGTCLSLSINSTSKYCCEVTDCWCDYCNSIKQCSIIETLPQYSGNQCCSSSTCCKTESCYDSTTCSDDGNGGQTCTTSTSCTCDETINERCFYQCGICYETHLKYVPRPPIPDLRNRSIVLNCGLNQTYCLENNEIKYAFNKTWACWYNSKDDTIVFDNNYKISGGLIAGTVILSMCALFCLIGMICCCCCDETKTFKTIMSLPTIKT